MFIVARKLTALLLASTLVFALQPSYFDKTEETPGRVVLRLQPLLSDLETVEGYTRLVSSQEGRTLETGMPEIPVYSLYIPVTSMDKPSVNYSILNTHTLQDIEVFPVQPALSSDTDGFDFYRNEDFYASREVYPQANVTISDVMTFRDLRLVRVDVIPCAYRPDTRELEVWDELELTVTGAGVGSGAYLGGRLRSRAFEPFYRQMLPDYAASQREEDYQTPAILYICGGNSISNPYFLQLADWRHRQGYEVYKATAGLIGNTPDDIKAYIENAYATFDPPPEYVALVGDAGGPYDIPTWFENWSQCYGGPCNGEGDYPYSLLEGDDLLPEVIIGRISVRNTQELAIVVSKTLNYEKVIGHDNAWFGSVGLLVNPEAGGGGQSLLSTNEYLQMLFQSQDYSDIRYDVEYNAVNASYWLNGQLDDGVSYLNFRGLYGPGSFDIDLIMNDISSHNMLPFMTFITCGTGSFAYEQASPSERFLRSGVSPSNYSGAVAAISTATVGTHTQFNNLLDMGVYDGIFIRRCQTAGAALVAGKLSLLNTYPDDPSHYVSIFSHWNNLMGDPALRLWTAAPVSLTVTHPASIAYGTDRVQVTVLDADSSPVENAMVTLTMEEDIFTSKITAADGSAVFSLHYQTDGLVNVTVTGENLKPYEGILIIDTVGPALNADDAIAIDDSEGNGDGLLNAGEQAVVTVTLENAGSNLTGGLAVLNSSSQHIAVETLPVEFGDLTTGSAVTLSFPVSVDANAADGPDTGLWLEVSDEAGNNWELGILLTIHAGTVSYSGYQLIEGETLQPGQTGEVALFLENIGTVAHENLTGELSYIGDQGVNLPILSGQWSAIQPGQSQTAADPFSIALDPNVITGSQLSFQIRLTDENGYDQTETFTIPAGISTVGDPTGPDGFGHYIYDSGDTAYALAPTYGWHEIDPSKGGEGELLPMADCGNGVPFDQESEIVQLPFELNYYGETYSEITVSTNGWIAFGPSDMATFRNTPVPGPGGPSPMLAVFWDDLRNLNANCFGSVGNISAYTADDSSYVVIEWSDVETFFAGDTESFEALLFRNETGQSGDNDIKLQYRKFNNTTSGLYLPAYNGLIHGGYATIGLEDHSGLEGLQYTYDNEYPVTAKPPEDNSALFITTRLPVDLFSVDTTLGAPPLTVQFTGNPIFENQSWDWDFDGDGQTDSTEPNPQWTFTEYGHYPVRVTVNDGDTEYVDLRRHYIHLVTYGCTDPLAENFDETAAMDDGSCTYIYGCMDPQALNYNISAVFDDGSCFYIEYTTLAGLDVENGDNFGRALSKSGDLAVIGAPKADVNNQMDQGMVYLFQLDELGNWTQAGSLTAEDGSLLDYFGYAVAIRGDYLLVGAYKADIDGSANVGAAYIFNRDADGDWTQIVKLIPEDGEANDNFGVSVALENGTAVVGAYRDDNENGENAGAVYLYEMDGASGWVQTAKLTADTGHGGDALGASVDISGSRIIAGANLYDGFSLNNCGAAFTFVRDEFGAWEQESLLTADDIDSFDHFGYSVAIDDSTALIGSYLDNNENGTIAGAAYIFNLTETGWVQEEKLVGVSGSDFYFGTTVGLDGNYAAVGSNQRLFLYRQDEEGQWSEGTGFVTNANEPVFIDSLHVLAGNYHGNIVEAYSLAEWEAWLAVDDPVGILPEGFSLGMNYPNPFNPVTVIPFDTPGYNEVSIVVYDLQGRQVATLLQGRQLPGRHLTEWNAKGFPSGVYFVRMEGTDFVQTRKVMLLK